MKNSIKGFTLVEVISAIVISAIIIILVVGCDKKKCDEGTVTGKLYKKAYTSHRMVGKVMIPIRHKEKWLIELNSSCTFEVDKETFDRLEIGDEIKNEVGECGSDEKQNNESN